MRILLVSEGNHELGRAEFAGALQVLVERLLSVVATFETDIVSSKSVRVHAGKTKGAYYKRAVAWIGAAERRGYDAIVLLIDEDEKPERVVGIDEAQNDTLFKLPRAFGVAIHSFDAWMLADEGALTRVLGVQIMRQKEPESNSDAKSACAQFLESSSLEISQAEFYSRLASAIDVNQLRSRCSSFEKFARRIEALIQT